MRNLIDKTNYRVPKKRRLNSNNEKKYFLSPADIAEHETPVCKPHDHVWIKLPKQMKNFHKAGVNAQEPCGVGYCKNQMLSPFRKCWVCNNCPVAWICDGCYTSLVILL